MKSKSRKKSITIKEKLNDYQSNNLKKEDLIYYLAFDDINCIRKNANEEELITITNACYQAWLKDRENYSITKFTTFVTENYINMNITLDDIKNASYRDIINDSIDNTLFYIKKEELIKEMER